MSNLTGTPVWSDVVQNETTTLVLGGPGGPMNEQAQSLTNRTEWLKNRMEACCESLSCVPCLKSMWIPADDFVPDTSTNVSIDTITPNTFTLDTITFAKGSGGAFAMVRMPDDWNNGPFWVDFDWTTSTDPSVDYDVDWSLLVTSAEPLGAGALAGTAQLQQNAVANATAFTAYTLINQKIYNLYATYNSDNTTFVMYLFRTGGADGLAESAIVTGATLHYTPKECDYNLLTGFYLSVDSCAGYDYSGDFYQEIVTNTDAVALQATSKVDVAADDWASITFTIELSGSEPAIDVTVSSTSPAFTAVTESAGPAATTVTVTVLNDLGVALAPDEIFTITLSAIPVADWAIKSIVLSKHDEPTGCAVVYSQP